MKFQNFAKISLLATATLFSCSSDDDSVDQEIVFDRVEVSDLLVYSFENEQGESIVNFGGQTTRLLQGEELLVNLRTLGTDIADLNLMYTGQPSTDSEGNPILESAGFENEDLNGTSRLLRGKTAASVSYFGVNTDEATQIRESFDALIAEEVTNFLGGQYTSMEEILDLAPAAEGDPGAILDGSSIRLVNENGLEVNQAFNKGLIGAIMGDQIMNHYLFLAGDTQAREDNANGVLEGDNPYTAIAHDWDEAYGYAFGNAGDQDSFLYKYIERVERDADFAGIKDEIQRAFIIGRQAIVDVDYDEVDRQAAILQELISEVIAIRAVFYLQEGKRQLTNEDTFGGAFHDLSEGFGFITSLRFTRNPETSAPYITTDAITAITTELQSGDGFWKYETDTTTLDDISAEIAAEFDFTVEQAATLLAVDE